MIDSKLIQDQPDLVAANNKKRGFEIDISVTQKLLSDRSALIGEVEKLRAEGNEIASKIPQATDAERGEWVAQGKKIKDQVKIKDEELKKVEEALVEELHKYPNILQADVLAGDESANQEISQNGEPTKFDFQVKDHLELGEGLGLIDVERAAKISGSRFAYFKNDFVQMEFALVNYVLSVLVPAGFSPIMPPHIISTKAMRAMGYLDHGGEDEVYHLKNDDAVLIGTSEQAVGPIFMDEMIAAEELPLRFVAFSPCYRREAGSYGKDVRGILRMHQFDKLEMFSYTLPEESNQEHELLLSMQERLMQGLKLPYRVIKLSAGDTGGPSARTYDIETWIPSQEMYRETHSTSNTTDYQARRLNTRYKKGKEKGFVHMLNGTAFAIGRIMIAIMENYQQADGSIEVPDILRSWMGKERIGI